MLRAEAKHAKISAAKQRVNTPDLPAGGRWITGLRQAALERLHDMGLPSRRDEYWRTTRPEAFAGTDVIAAAVLQSDEATVFASSDNLNVVFVDGVLDLAASDDLTGENLEITPLSVASARDIHWAKETYSKLEARGQDPVERPFAALNSALATEGLIIRATGPVSRPLCIQYVRLNPAADAMIHHVIKLEKGSDLTVLEGGAAAARLNKVVEVEIDDDAHFHHVATQGRDHERRELCQMFAHIGAASTFKSFTLTVNGALCRNETVITLGGDDSHATIAGASVGDGASGTFHQDDTVFITHDAVNCESRQVFKKVLRNGATGVFQGKILVKPDAQKTDGYQISQSLMLDDASQFLAKPELEIYADDVACSHGSTVGAIDEDALFYLVSRGVPRGRAQDMLVLAFLTQALNEIENDVLREDLRLRLDTWVERHNR